MVFGGIGREVSSLFFIVDNNDRYNKLQIAVAQHKKKVRSTCYVFDLLLYK